MKKLKNIFIFLFYISVVSLLCQNSVVNYFKDGSFIKKQLTSSITNTAEEEEEDGNEESKVPKEVLTTLSAVLVTSFASLIMFCALTTSCIMEFYEKIPSPPPDTIHQAL